MNSSRGLAGAILAGVVLVGCGEANQPTEEWLMIDKVNEVRAAGVYCGDEWQAPVGELLPHPDLDLVAEAHALDMDLNGFFSHIGSDGMTVAARTQQADSVWRIVGENLAMGFASDSEAFAAWMDSAGHCKVIMGDRFEFLGLGRSGEYTVLVLGARVE